MSIESGDLPVQTKETAERHVPRTREVRGMVKGVTFDQANSRVCIGDETGTVLICQASPSVVEMAVKIHKFAVVGTILVRNDQVRLINIHADGDPKCTLGQEERVAYLLEQWDEALKRLAE